MMGDEVEAVYAARSRAPGVLPNPIAFRTPTPPEARQPPRYLPQVGFRRTGGPTATALAEVNECRLFVKRPRGGAAVQRALPSAAPRASGPPPTGTIGQRQSFAEARFAYVEPGEATWVSRTLVRGGRQSMHAKPTPAVFSD